MTDVLLDPEDPSRAIIGNATDWKWGISQGASVLEGVHLATRCAGEFCVIHHPSDHHMRRWLLTWRDDKGVMERQCPHGVGHPDPDDVAFLVRSYAEDRTLHGCDGCCRELVNA